MSGPSGSGKGTLIKKLLNECSGIKLSVSVTTRKPRSTEVDGREYYFISKDEFDSLIKGNHFLEHARVHDFYYGTTIDEVEKNILNKNDVILEIDPQGAFQVKEKMPEAILIFIQPPSISDLEQRLRNRATDSDEVISKRIKDAQGELSQAKLYDYVIINDEISKAGKELVEIIERERNND